MGSTGKNTDTAKTERHLRQAAEMNEELMLAVVRQHELTEAAERLNAQLQTEIADRKRAVDALEASELSYRRIFESASDGIMLLDADKATAYDVNPSLTGMLGYTREEMLGKKLWDICPERDKETAKMAFGELLKEEQAHFKNLPLQTSDGRVVEVEVTSSVYKVGRTRLVQCNFRDITERNALEKRKADFYAMVTHDIRSPLMLISGYSELLMSRAFDFDVETKEILAAIMKSVDSISQLVENFLSISKAEGGRVALNAVPTDIAALLRNACLDIEMEVREKKLDLQAEIADGLPMVMVDSRLIQRAVLNLLHNAVNYTSAPGKIVLKAGSEGENFIVISVTDTGAGIPAGEQEAVFEKYYRSMKTSGIQGSGLGLAIVKAAAEVHGGRVELESGPGKGSTFSLFIPVNQKTEEGA